MPRMRNLLASMRRQAPSAKLYGISDFSPLNQYATQVSGGEAGALGLTSFALCRIESMASTVNPRVLVDRFQNGVGGWTSYFNATAGTFQGAVHDGGAVVRNTALAPFLPSDIGKMLLLAVQLTTTGALRVFFMRAQQYGADTVITGFTPAAARHLIGNRQESLSNLPLIGVSVFAHATVHGDLTLAQMQDVYDQTRIAETIPESVLGVTWAHRWTARDALFGLSVGNGQVAPATLEDTVTFLAAHAMSRQGSPTVKVIDTKAEGRETFGALGLGDVNHLTTALGANTGVVGSVGGFYIQARVNLGSVSTLSTFASRSSSNQNGYYLEEFSGNIRFRAGNGSTLILAPTVARAGYIGRPVIVTGVWDAAGQLARLNIDGIEAGPGTAMTAYVPATGATTAMLVGRSFGGGDGVHGNVVYEVSGGDIVPTASALLAQATASQNAGRLIPLVGANHHYPITPEVKANGGSKNGFPSQVKDRIGTDHLTRQGGLTVGPGNSVRSFSAGNFLRTIAGAGLLGVASGFWFEVLITKASGAVDAIVFAAYSGKGYYLNIYNGTAYVALRAVSGGGLFTPTPYSLADGLRHIAMVYDGSVARLYVDGVERGVSASFVFDPATATEATTIGVQTISGLYPAGQQSVHGASGGNFIPSAGEIATASATALSTGKVAGVPGKTTGRWSVVDDVNEAGGKVPAYVKERVSGVDHMITVGAPIQVSEKTERLWSYETSPVMQGTGPLDTTSKYVAVIGGTLGEQATAFWWGIALAVTSQPALGIQHLCGKRNASFTAGWGMASTLNNTQIAPRVVTGGSGLLTGPIATIAAADVHKTMLIGGVFDPINAVLRTYHKRAEVGSGSGLSGTYLSPGSLAPCTMAGGLLTALGSPAAATVTGIRIYGMMCGSGLPNLARWQAAFDACQAHEDIIEIPGYTEHLWSWNRDAREGLDPWVSGVRDRIGTDHMTTYGGVSNEATFARAFGW